jgi:hypothetical protein
MMLAALLSALALVPGPADFSTRIDNPYWPMPPGTRWTYRAGAERDVVTVTRATRRLADGVTARVVRDTAVRGGEVVEDTFDFYAQDRQGTVWYLGEDTAEFEHGRLRSREGSFEAGVDGARPGIVMPARPRRGMRYRQELYRGHAEDRAEILSTRELAQTPFGRFDRVLLTKETNRLEPGVLEYKLYAPGVGPVLSLLVSGGSEREELMTMDRAPAAWVRRAATAPLGRGPIPPAARSR